MKRVFLAIVLSFLIGGAANGADISDPIDTSIKANKRYQFYSTLGTYTSVTIDVKTDLNKKPAGLGYVLNKGNQDIEIFPNYVDDPTNTMNGINVSGSNTVWNFSPSNFRIDSLKIRSTTVDLLIIEILIH